MSARVCELAGITTARRPRASAGFPHAQGILPARRITSMASRSAATCTSTRARKVRKQGAERMLLNAGLPRSTRQNGLGAGEKALETGTGIGFAARVGQ